MARHPQNGWSNCGFDLAEHELNIFRSTIAVPLVNPIPQRRVYWKEVDRHAIQEQRLDFGRGRRSASGRPGVRLAVRYFTDRCRQQPVAAPQSEVQLHGFYDALYL